MSTVVGSQSDALVFFGAIGDLAYKQVFPALYAIVRDARLSVPIVGVAGRPWTSDQLRQRAQESIAEQNEIDEPTFGRFASLLSYVGGNYNGRLSPFVSRFSETWTHTLAAAPHGPSIAKGHRHHLEAHPMSMGLRSSD